MPALSNARHELFAQNVAAGMTSNVAHVAAGYTHNYSNAAKLRDRPEIDARIRELLDTAVGKTLVTAERVLNELALLAFSNVMDYMSIDTDGTPIVNFAALTRAQAAAICEVTVDEYKSGHGAAARDIRRIRFKLFDKRGALTDLAKHLGMFRTAYDFAGAAMPEIERVIIDDDENNGSTGDT